MSNIIQPDANPNQFLQKAMANGFSMQESFFDPAIGDQISSELEHAGYLVDYTELKPTTAFEANGMHFAQLLHSTISRLVCRVDTSSANPLPCFSVRVFTPGEHGTTVHRNDPSIGPWAVGLTLKGEAPFNVYSQHQLPDYDTLPLRGDESDPVPLETMNADQGSAWTLYTKNQLVPHSSGIVHSQTQRELLIFYGTSWNR
ncbi:hypothetical protein A2707_02195 [Candidatus Saccharibacteria bacterium RIFCSPHIGHO2_01_FULL_45_15]|nr:MAG: hypothetical protein A2707_02195 [Candidatus Saccharibacteria bacterium RIFCSPHIGHO2_01_FULL_45_15]OGL28721.1 MAG: hypothetical protein A3C39_00025 [Candidatus Saccharibacteria bacterium RIFCSPHIGHO2_02_FULL_46_12]OGL31613.1 MAG: hypothetical protein A3E76_00645 [Candidatus Saccharibacteria bacterium RIFCSPHIGHO2_12_FULL_44_22]